MVPGLNMVTNSLIPHFEVDRVHNPIRDGNCGFRALAAELFDNEDIYVDIKEAVLNHYLTSIDGIYKNYDQYQIKGILDPHSNKWFCAPECARLLLIHSKHLSQFSVCNPIRSSLSNTHHLMQNAQIQ